MFKSLLLTISLISVGAFAAKSKSAPELPAYRAVSYLHWKDAQGKQQRATLHVEDKKLRINALEIPKTSWKKGQEAVTALTTVQNSVKKACAGGVSGYTLRVQKGEKHSVTEFGCTDSPRFKDLLKNVDALKAMAP